MYAVTPGPYGSLLALTWYKPSQTAAILYLDAAAGADEPAGRVLEVPSGRVPSLLR